MTGGGRVALLSGATRGIDAAVAEALAAAGGQLSLGVRDPDAPGLPAGAHAVRHDAFADDEVEWVVLLASLSGKRVRCAEFASCAMPSMQSWRSGAASGRPAGPTASAPRASTPGFVDTNMARAITDRPAARLTAPAEIVHLVELALDPPNNAVMPERTVSCQLEERY